MIGRGRALLLPDECGDSQQTDQGGSGEPHPPLAEMLQLVERKQHRADCQHQQRAACRVELLARRGSHVRGQQPRQHEGRQCKGNAEPEHCGPVDDRHQHAGNRRAERAAEADDHGVYAEYTDARCLGIQAGRQGRTATQHQCGTDTLHDARDEQCAVAWRHGAQHERHRAPAAAGEEDAPIAEHVADSSEHQHQRGVGQRVGDDDPLDRRYRQAECPRDVREGEIDRRIERHHQRAERHHQHAEARPRGKAGARNKERARAHHTLLAPVGVGMGFRPSSSMSARP